MDETFLRDDFYIFVVRYNGNIISIVTDWDPDLMSSKFDNQIKQRKLEDKRNDMICERLHFTIGDKNPKGMWSLYIWKQEENSNIATIRYTISESTISNEKATNFIIYNNGIFIDYALPI